MLADISPTLYQEYLVELLKEKYNRPIAQPVDTTVALLKTTRKPVFSLPSYNEYLRPLSTLPAEHQAIIYTQSRKIECLDRVFWTDNFAATVAYLNPLNEIKLKSEPRLCLILRDERQSVFGVVGRSLDPQSSLRYITIKFDVEAAKLYGLDSLDKNKPTFLC